MHHTERGACYVHPPYLTVLAYMEPWSFNNSTKRLWPVVYPRANYVKCLHQYFYAYDPDPWNATLITTTRTPEHKAKFSLFNGQPHQKEPRIMVNPLNNYRFLAVSPVLLLQKLQIFSLVPCCTSSFWVQQKKKKKKERKRNQLLITSLPKHALPGFCVVPVDWSGGWFACQWPVINTLPFA